MGRNMNGNMEYIFPPLHAKEKEEEKRTRARVDSIFFSRDKDPTFSESNAHTTNHQTKVKLHVPACERVLHSSLSAAPPAYLNCNFKQSHLISSHRS